MRLPAELPHALRFALALALVAGAATATAKSTDRQQAMDITAAQVDAVLTDDGDARMKGDVVITQGTLNVHADDALVTRKGGEIDEVVLTGAPAVLTQVNDNGEKMTARAAKIVYTISTELIVMTGGVVVNQPRGNLKGEMIKYDLTTGRLDGGGGGGRVSMRILPKSAKPAGDN
jgi:lipopolysaccharide export system protein LptA